MSAIDLRTLGPFEAWIDGDAVDLGSRIQRCVLALLTASFGETVSADRMVSEVWGESPPAKPSQSLQTYVSNLRRLLGKETIETRNSGYRLAVPAESIDAERFRTALTAAGFNGDPVGVKSSLEQALNLWRGAKAYQALADDVPRLREESVRLGEMRLAAIERLYETRLRLGEQADVIPELQHWTAEHPYREHLSGLLMRALYATGRQAEALGIYRGLRTRLVEELGIEPSPDLQELEIRILSQTEKVQSRRRQGPRRLPHFPTDLIGRDDDLEALRQVLGEHRIVTVAGPAGVGKTRLAVEVGHQLIDDYPDGVLFADLSTISSGGDIAKAVMAGIGLSDQSTRSPESVVANFLVSSDALLILDNCEHVADSASALVWEWVTSSPDLTVLSTSQRSLGLTGEKVFTLLPLATEDASHDSPSAHLFLQRAGEVDPGLHPSQQERRLVDQICQRLDGIPLALELAAGRLQTLTLEELHDALDERLHLLTGRRGGDTGRHAALIDSLEWTYSLLDDDERSLFESLSVIRGAFSLRVAGAVGGIESDPVVMDVVDRLVKWSLIQRDMKDQSSHFRMLETMRLFGRARLTEHGELDAAEKRRANYFAAIAVDQARRIKGHEHRSAVETISDNLDNMRPAFNWAMDQGRFDTAFSLTRPLWGLVFVGARRHLYEGQVWRERLAGITTDVSMRARLLAELAFASFVLGDQKKAEALAGESLNVSDASCSKTMALEAMALCAATNRETARAADLARTVIELHGDDFDAHGLEALAFAQIFGGDLAAAVETVQQVFEEADRRGDPLRHIRALALMGAALQGTDLDRSRDILDEAVARTEDLGMEWDLAGAVMARSLTHLMAGRVPEALDDLERACALTYDVGDGRRLAQTIEILGSILTRLGHNAEAVEMLAAAQELRQLSDVVGSEVEEERRQTALSQLEAALGSERFDQVMAEGKAATPSEASARAVELARVTRAQLDTTARPPSPST